MARWTTKWITATALGWACGIVIAVALDFQLAACAAAGILIGTAQWLVLRNRFRLPGLWILASALGWLAGMQLGIPRGFFSLDPYSTGLAGGAVAGLLQSFILWRQVRWAGLWTAGSIVSSLWGWIAGSVVGWGYLLRGLNHEITFIAAALAGGLVAGALSAPVLLWLLDRPFTGSIEIPAES